MNIFSEWKKNKMLKKQMEECNFRLAELEDKLKKVMDSAGNGNIIDNLTNELSRKEKDLNRLKVEFDKLKEWSGRLLEISKKESSELAYVKFRYFNLIKENQNTEMNLTGFEKNYAFALNRFEQLREENLKLKNELEKLKRDKVIKNSKTGNLA
jgi:hypothetical protein